MIPVATIVSTLRKGNNMTVELGIGMFVYNMIALLIGAIIVYKIINNNNDRE